MQLYLCLNAGFLYCVVTSTEVVDCHPKSQPLFLQRNLFQGLDLNSKSTSTCTRMCQVAECQAMAGRLADQLAPCDTQPAQAMDEDLAADMAGEEHNIPHGAEEAPAEYPVADVAPDERAEAETASEEERRAEGQPATARRQSGRGKDKVTQCTTSKGKVLIIQGDMRTCLSSMLCVGA